MNRIGISYRDIVLDVGGYQDLVFGDNNLMSNLYIGLEDTITIDKQLITYTQGFNGVQSNIIEENQVIELDMSLVIRDNLIISEKMVELDYLSVLRAYIFASIKRGGIFRGVIDNNIDTYIKNIIDIDILYKYELDNKSLVINIKGEKLPLSNILITDKVISFSNIYQNKKTDINFFISFYYIMV